MWTRELIFYFLICCAGLETSLVLGKKKPEPVIEDISGKDLETLVEEKDLVAVFWYKGKCKECDKVLEELEKIDDDTDHFGVEFVKINDRKTAKHYGVKTFPTLQYFRNGEPISYEGDLMDEDKVLDFLTSLDAMDLPDQIEEVSANMMEKIVEEHDFVAVLFYKNKDKMSIKALAELENIDDEADQLGIAMVKIEDEALADEYNLEHIPALVYYRHQIPIVYDGDLNVEEEVLEWLVEHKGTGSDDDFIEDVTPSTLVTLIDSVDQLAVIFYDPDDNDTEEILTQLETIDDDCDQLGISMVKIGDIAAAKEYGVDDFPTMIFFKLEFPNVFTGDLKSAEFVLKWLTERMEVDEIEDVTDEILDKLIETSKYLAVLFYDETAVSKSVLAELENIDDECEQAGISFVKIRNEEEAKQYGLDELPALLYFERGIPSIYDDDLEDEFSVLKWLVEQTKTDGIEEVNDEILETLIKKLPHIAVVFYDDEDKKSQSVLKDMETIDDECDQHNIAFVKVNDPKEAAEWGIDHIPALVFFEHEIPNIFEGDLNDESAVLKWLINCIQNDEISEITGEMLERLQDKVPYLAVLFMDEDSHEDMEILTELEKIDDECKSLDIVFVMVDDDEEAAKFGLDDLPGLIYFENGIPSIYEGDLRVEEEVLNWLTEQKTSSTIEEVTDEILDDLIEKHEYLAVYFSGSDCDENEPCHAILNDLENIDDELDEIGVILLTTEDTAFAKKHGVTDFPAVVLFRNGEPLHFKGDVTDEDDVLTWLTDEENLEIADRIEEVNLKMLEKKIQTEDDVVVFFYNHDDRKSHKILFELENIDDECDEDDIDFVKISDDGVAEAYEVAKLPSLVYFKKRQPPKIYEGDLLEENKILLWIKEHKKTEVAEEALIEKVDKQQLDMMIHEFENVAVLFYNANCENCDAILEELESIDDDTDKHDIHFVKTMEVEYAKQYGVENTPSLVYFEKSKANIYSGDLMNEDEVLDWILYQKVEDTIENINRELLNKYIEEKDFLAVVFYKSNDTDSERALKHLEVIDDDLAEFDVDIVKMEDRLMAKKYGFRNPPGLAYFRKGTPVKYDGDLFDEEEVLEWLTDPDNMELNDMIEKVNKKMLFKILSRSQYLAALFYNEDDCKQCSKVLQELENIDDDAHKEGIQFVKIDDTKMAREYGIYALPALLYFREGSEEPIIYAGDLKQEEKILEWLMFEKNPGVDVIEEMGGEKLRQLIKETEGIAVYLYDPASCEDCDSVLQELETIDDDTDRHNIGFVKTQDKSFAEAYGVETLPALIYFEKEIPSYYEGDLQEEEEVLQWLILHKTEDRIESVNRNILERMVEETQYLAVYFYKQNCRACDMVLHELENIDDECDLFGIQMVKINDPQLAKRYSIKTFPSLIYFRNGNPLVFDGDLKNEESVLEWLVDDDNRELADEIESVNSRMLEKLIKESPFVAVFFYDKDCPDCPGILAVLENIDDEADLFGIDFVKIEDPEAGKPHGILSTPSLVYFRKGTPLLYEDDLNDEEKILAWLTSQENLELREEIEEVNKKMLEKLLDENDFVAVLYYENNCPRCDEVLEELEKVDVEVDNLDIRFVKIKDTRYARKYGINKLPALVYFRRKFPSIYRGELATGAEVLEWLQKNRYRHPELNIFMYALTAITGAFIAYTLFLMFCFKGSHQKAA